MLPGISIAEKSLGIFWVELCGGVSGAWVGIVKVDLLDVIKRRGGFLAFDARHDPLAAVATSSAITATAAGALTMPM